MGEITRIDGTEKNHNSTHLIHSKDLPCTVTATVAVLFFCPHTCGLLLNAYSMQHKRTPCRSPPVIAETIEFVCKLTWRVKKCVN